MKTIETNSELDQAAEEFFQAAERYRQVAKRNGVHGGVIWLRRGVELIAFSHIEKYSNQICSMTFDWERDDLVFTRAEHLPDSTPETEEKE